MPGLVDYSRLLVAELVDAGAFNDVSGAIQRRTGAKVAAAAPCSG